MTGIQVTRVRRRIADMIDALHRLDRARISESMSQSYHGKRMRERQAAQREEIFDTFDKLVEAHSVLDRTKAELEGAQAANKKLHDELAAVKERFRVYKTAMYGLVYGAPSCVLAASLKTQEQTANQRCTSTPQTKPSTLTPSGGVYKYNPDSPPLETNEPQVAGCDQNVKAKQATSDSSAAYPFVVYRKGDRWRILDSRTGHTHYNEFPFSDTAHATARSLAEAGNHLAIGADGWPRIYKA